MKTIVPSPHTTENCSSSSLATAIELVGDWWTLYIVDVLRAGELRFCEIERSLPHSNPATLAKRLKQLESCEVIVRRVETLDKQSVTYSLSSRGIDLLPVLEAIKAFARADST